LSTSLEADELLTEVGLPPWKDATGWSVQEFARRSGDFAIAGAMTTLSLDGDGRVRDPRISLIGVAPTAVRATSAEETLAGEPASDQLWIEGGERAASGIEPPSDLHGTAAYRRQLTKALVRRSLVEAASRAGGAA
jgi:carbon-monoxide dehydrogenase medium subunit